MQETLPLFEHLLLRVGTIWGVQTRLFNWLALPPKSKESVSCGLWMLPRELETPHFEVSSERKPKENRISSPLRVASSTLISLTLAGLVVPPRGPHFLGRNVANGTSQGSCLCSGG